MLINNAINIFLIVPNIILYYFCFIKYLWISKISLVSIELKSAGKNIAIPFNPVFFWFFVCFFYILLTVKSFEILPEHKV